MGVVGSAAQHARNAAAAAEEAAEHAGEAEDAAQRATQHANAAIEAAKTATDAAKQAKKVVELAREAEAQRIRANKQEAIAEAKEAAERYEEEQNHTEWKEAEETRVDAETRRLLDAATDPDADAETVVRKGRQAAVNLMTTGGPWTKQAAQHALSGTDADIRQWVNHGREAAAKQDDWERVNHIVDTGEPKALREAAKEALGGSHEELREFLRNQDYPGEEDDDRLRATQILANATGPTVKKAANEALDGTHADVEKFLEHGQYEAREHDNRINVLRIMDSGGPRLEATGQAALNGPPEFLRNFLDVGQHLAKERDSRATVHHAEMQRLVKRGMEAAAEAQQHAYKAAQSAAKVRDAAEEAAQYAQQAQDSADQAAQYAEQAQQSAREARESADRAARAAKTAQKSAENARNSAEQAAVSVATANSAAQEARSYSRDAYGAASRARRSAREAGQDAKAAADAALEALQTSLRKQREEEQAIRDAIKNGEAEQGIPAKQFENSTVVARVNGTCYLNGIELPDNIGTGSCESLAFDLDIWIGNNRLDWKTIEEKGKDGTAALLTSYCFSHSKACGNDLKVKLIENLTLSDVVSVTLPKEAGLGVGRLLRAALRPALRAMGLQRRGEPKNISRVPVKFQEKNLPEFRSGKALFRHYLKHVRNIKIERNGKIAKEKDNADMPMMSLRQYREEAQKLLKNNPNKAVREHTRNNGDILRLDKETGYFGVKKSDGTIKIFFKPDDPIKYFEKQIK
ncbi:ALF repeat-containing protein [Actinopolyspora mortivallis]|uniref:ALF repeat-containing protein n=1 Tax=Actinopolyspora mortivallis TaxID=33906 RepID=UPI00146BC91F|nr:ALF repeat-containing protein [Actinopolyspora mortivallis]